MDNNCFLECSIDQLVELCEPDVLPEYFKMDDSLNPPKYEIKQDFYFLD